MVIKFKLEITSETNENIKKIITGEITRETLMESIREMYSGFHSMYSQIESKKVSTAPYDPKLVTNNCSKSIFNFEDKNIEEELFNIIKNDSDPYYRKVFREDFFRLIQEYVSQRDQQVARMANCMNEQNKTDHQSQFNMSLKRLEDNIQNDKHVFNSTGTQKKLLHNSKVLMDNFYENYKNDINLLTLSKRNKETKIQSLINNIHIQKYDLDRSIFERIGVSCLSKATSLPENTCLITDARGQIYFIGGQKNSTVVADILRLDLKLMLLEKIASMSTPRTKCKAVYDSNHDQFIIIGGIDDKGLVLKSVEKFSLVTRKSKPMKELNQARHSFSLCFISSDQGESSLFISGGVDQEMKILDTCETQIIKEGENWKITKYLLPLGLRGSESFFYKGMIQVVGGQDGLNYHSEIHMIDTAKNKVYSNVYTLDQNGTCNERIIQKNSQIQIANGINGLTKIELEGQSLENKDLKFDQNTSQEKSKGKNDQVDTKVDRIRLFTLV